MRRALVSTVGCLALLAPAAAQAKVLSFQGEARIDLHERLDHDDPYTLETTVVDLVIELHAPRLSHTVQAVGTATIGRDDGSTTRIPLTAAMYPPEGSGGLVHAVGPGDDRSAYCFRIWDLVDAPTPRPDTVVAAFEPLDRFTVGFLATPSSPALTDICYALEYRSAPPHSGDFSFSEIP